MSRWLALSLILLAAGAAALRLPQLDRRPMHTDEAVHAVKFRDLLEAGRYTYDPNEFHGPSLYYFTLPVVRFTSGEDFTRSTEAQYRIVPLLFCVGLILLLGLVADGLGKTAVFFAGLLNAVSPAMVYYSRYYIHELILVFFTMLFLGSVWRHLQRPKVGWSLLAGLSLGMMHATKETWVIAFLALAGAAWLNWVWIRRGEKQTANLKPACHARYWICGLAMAFGVAVVLFTSFFTHPSGPLDSLRTYLPWIQRAEGQTAHVHPWHYYLGLLTWFHQPKGPVFTEGFIMVFALVGVLSSLVWPDRNEGNHRFVRFVGFYTILLTVAYCLIRYKTPWCMLGFLHGMILLAGVGMAFLWRICCPLALTAFASRGKVEVTKAAMGDRGGDLRSFRDPSRTPVGRLSFLCRTFCFAVIAAGCAHLFYQAYLASYPFGADPKNPYVYFHTLPDITRLTQTVEKVAQTHPEKHNLPIQVIVPGSAQYYWPLPWYLRAFKNIGWWTELPENMDAPVIISSSKLDNVLDPRLSGTYVPAGYYAHRPRIFLELYVKRDVWMEYLKHFPPQSEVLTR
jgi:uncharacterized protein (TIGR03663 family)